MPKGKIAKKVLQRGEKFASKEEVGALLLAGHGVVVFERAGEVVLYTDPKNLKEGLESGAGINPARCQELFRGLDGCSCLHSEGSSPVIIIKGRGIACSGAKDRGYVCIFGCGGIKPSSSIILLESSR